MVRFLSLISGNPSNIRVCVLMLLELIVLEVLQWLFSPAGDNYRHRFEGGFFLRSEKFWRIQNTGVFQLALQGLGSSLFHMRYNSD